MLEEIGEFAGARHFVLRPFHDERGSFLKVFHADSFEAAGLPTAWPESYVSFSNPGVARGMHFQLPPHDYDKVVVALDGEVDDVALDLRTSSPYFKTHRLFRLRAGEAIFLPKGFAHGFRVPGPAPARLLYFTGTAHSPSHDAGILWSSLPLDWPVRDTITSARDKRFPTLAEFRSPF